MLAKIGAAGAAGQFDEVEQFFVQGKSAGLSELQMYEAVLNLLPYIGYPRTLSTMSRFQTIYPQYIRERSAGKDPQPTEPWEKYALRWGERGAEIRRQLGLGGPGAEDFVRQLTLLSPELTEWVVYDDFGRIFGRAGLSLIEREAIIIGVLIAQGAPQIAAHRGAMLRVGGSDELIDSLLAAVSGIVDEKALTASRQHLAEARKR
jgi:alkylhydroperoxidase/carboxymuconolactone decarboxylase family protein YurZ